MNELKIFENKEFGQIRTVQLNNEPYFCMADICRALDIKNISDAKTRLNEDGVVSNEVIDSLGRKQQANFINESNMYKLIFQSRKESAEKFTDWVTSEVLPSIRQTGQYQLPNLSKEMQALFILDERTVKMEQRMDRIEFDNPLHAVEAEELSNHVKRKGVEILGGKKSEAYKDTKVRQRVYTDIYNQIKREYGIYSDDGSLRSYKALKRKYIQEAHKLVDCYEAPLYLQETINEANAQLSFT